jgi:hypothetical protein
MPKLPVILAQVALFLPGNINIPGKKNNRTWGKFGANFARLRFRLQYFTFSTSILHFFDLIKVKAVIKYSKQASKVIKYSKQASKVIKYSKQASITIKYSKQASITIKYSKQASIIGGIVWFSMLLFCYYFLVFLLGM